MNFPRLIILVIVFFILLESLYIYSRVQFIKKGDMSWKILLYMWIIGLIILLFYFDF